MKKTDLVDITFPIPKEKGKYPIVDIPANGKPCWHKGAFTLAFVYSKYDGNFILRGYRGEVNEYLKRNFTHYFYYTSMWSDGKSRGYWRFWKDGVSILTPSKEHKEWKYRFVSRSTKHQYDDLRSFGEDQKPKTLYFKRIPKRWISEFDAL